MKNKKAKRFSIITAALLALNFIAQGFSSLALDLVHLVSAETAGNSVYFSSTIVEASDTNIIYVDLIAKGEPNDKIKVTYKTISATAIDSIDYNGVENTITLDIPKDSDIKKYTVAIKCLNDSSNREQLRIYDEKNNIYGRYFNLKIVYAENAIIDAEKGTCKCYLTYNHRVGATVNPSTDPMLGNKKVAYLNDYKTMLMQYDGGTYELDGGDTRKTWKKGVSFNNDTTQRWVKSYIETGLAKAYGSIVSNDLDDSGTSYITAGEGKISVLFGNKEFIDKYTRDKNCPGLSMYVKVNPPGTKLNGRAMYYIARGTNPYKKDDDLVDVAIYKTGDDHEQIYWILDRSTWFASENSTYDSEFYRIDPYNGVLDLGAAFYNHNKECDMIVRNVWMMMTLYDKTAPTIVNQYAEYSYDSKGLRIYLRFNEPVYSCKPNSYLTVKFNNSTREYDAKYVDGNFSDTLVYEIPEESLTNTKIESMTYTMLDGDIGDMAYKLDFYKNVNNNKVQNADQERQISIINNIIDLSQPTLAVDIADSQYSPHNVYNIVLSANDNGAKDFDAGTIYYSWSKEDWSSKTKEEKEIPSLYDYSHVLTSEEKGSFTVSLAQNANLGIDGGLYYLHALAVSTFGKMDVETFGPYYLDGDAPSIFGLTLPTNTLQEKIYNLEIAKKSIRNLALNVKYKTGVMQKEESAKLTLISNGAKETGIGSRLLIQDDGTKITYKYFSNITGDLLDPFIQELMGTTDRFEGDFYFTVEDMATNKATSDTIHVVYDKRTTFPLDVNAPVSYVKISDISVGKDVYNIANAGSDGITLTIPDTTITEESPTKYRDYIDQGAKYSALINGSELIEAEPGSYSITLSDLKPGYYDVIARIHGPTSGSGDVNLVSQSVCFYLTNDLADATMNKTNANSNLVLTNKVFQLEDARYYYFNNSNNSVENHLYGATFNSSNARYEGGASTPTFSSSVEAKKYIKFMEHQDIFAMSITDAIASLLNSGTGSTLYVKAPGETRNASAGQIWVRYKKNTWTSTTGGTGWAFYYYGEGSVEDGVNINGLSPNLNKAIDDVVNRIVNTGKDKYLVEEGDISQSTGAPYLAESQMHINVETAETTKCGTPYVSNPVYNGDPNLYQNNVIIGEESYPIVTNLKLSVSNSTSLYYKERFTGEMPEITGTLGEGGDITVLPEASTCDGNAYKVITGGKYADIDARVGDIFVSNGTIWTLIPDHWNQIEAKDGDLLSNALKDQDTGVYSMREYGPNGVSEFSFYLDRTLPVLNTIKDKGLESESELPLDGTVVNITCKSLTLESLVNEADPYAYVAIYSYPNKVLQKVLYQADIKDFSLSGGNFYLQVGDRSGNMATYTVLTSSSDIDLVVEENESKTGVMVKINNRNDSEIYSYEVYLNETLIDSEFANSKYYRESGIYRIEVVDIYGNKETRTVSHESPSPDIVWYYLNENDTYSIYDPSKPTRMILEDDPSSSRTTNIYSSTLVRLLLKSDYENGDIKFEISGIDVSDYSFNETTGFLSINSLSGWRLRVWYEDQPENDHTYIFYLDNESPTVAATFVGTSFYQVIQYDEEGNVIYTSTFDAINFDNYEVGDLITLDSLDYTIEGTSTITFENGAIICGSHIVIQVNDPSGIRSFTVTRNGQPLDMQLNVDNKLLINSYGYYVITFVDGLGNVSVFSFNNVEGLITKGQVDGDYIKENEMNYGHDEIVVNTLYNGTNTFLINYGDNSDVYVFVSDGRTVTYGQYVVREGGVDEEGSPIEGKYALFVPNQDFELLIDEDLTRLNVWYTAISNDNYIVYVMLDDDLHVNYRVVCGKELITVESSFTVGNVHLPNHYIATLSKEIPTITLLTGEEVVEQKEGLEFIYIADDLTIKADSVSSNIKTIEYSYSANTPEFEETIIIYENGKFKLDFVGHEDGFYQITVTNIYNNQTTYLLCKIDSFISEVTVFTLDGSSRPFYENEGTFYANSAIQLTIFSETVYFEVNGVTTSGVVEKGKTILELTREGDYNVRVVGSNGIFEDFTFNIDTDEEFVFEEDWITGYNEEALLRDQGYTNTLCSINLDEEVIFVDMVVNDELYVLLYDNISDTADRKTDTEVLKEVIGKYGVGKYVVGFRNKYGDLVTKTVYFNNIPSLYLDRVTTSNPSVYQPYDLDFAVEKDFYSNYVLRFSTSSQQYIFTINGEEYRLDEPKTIEFSNISGKGSFSYEITYRDEYGNNVSFNAILYREDVTLDTSSMNIITINGDLYTKDDICITFDESYKATVSIDNGSAIDYTNGYTFYADGEYRFVVRDIAGNTVNYTVIHKSDNHYTLTNTSTGEIVSTGGVVNNGNVNFYPEDGSRIKYVFRDGELIEGYSSNNFVKTGHWELIIEDSIGNQSYEDFYILNNPLSTFTYEAPFGYEVTEVWRIRPDGSRESLNYRGTKITLNENGDYVVIVMNKATVSSFNFSVAIDDTKPAATLNGVENEGVTARDVTLSGLKSGDVVKIYKDGELVSTTDISLSNDVPAITTGGKYRITITNVQGVTVEYNFTRKAVTNVAGSIFIMVTAGLLMAGVTIGLVYHTKLKTDD